MNKNDFFKKISNYYAVVGIAILVVSIVLILIPFGPYILYSLNPSETTNEVAKITASVTENNTVVTQDSASTLPAIDTSLPTTPYIKMEKIGVYSPISTETDYIAALKKGAWIVPEYGTPTNGKTPIIIAAHRFGYLYWDDATRKLISFYNLPKMHVGDTIEIIWEQRTFKYKIYKEEDNTYITDYNADLILYTCKYFDSPVRIFRYAKLVTE